MKGCHGNNWSGRPSKEDGGVPLMAHVPQGTERAKLSRYKYGVLRWSGETTVSPVTGGYRLVVPLTVANNFFIYSLSVIRVIPGDGVVYLVGQKSQLDC